MEFLIQLLGGPEKYLEMLEILSEKDPQSADLVAKVSEKLGQALELDDSLHHALRRLQWISENLKTADAALLRNNAFKAANSAGLPLPHGIF
jgi:hypothetical protein